MIYLFSHSYPYNSKAEFFLAEELKFIPKEVEVTLVPLLKVEEAVVSPENIRQTAPILGRNLIWKLKVGLKMFFGACFWKLPGDFNPRLSFFSCLKQGVKYLYAAYAVAQWMQDSRDDFHSGDVFYSFWNNHTPLGFKLSSLKNGYRFYTRGHGYDIYEEKVGVYIPFRKEALAFMDGIYPCSEKGRTFLSERYPEVASRIKTAKLGCYYPMKGQIQASGQDKGGEFRVVSCSHISAVKRVELMFESLWNFASKHPQYNMVWEHFGEGELRGELEKKIQDRGSLGNLKVVLRGWMKNTEIRENYFRNTYHVFLNTSSSEGIPVAMMEAIEAGIPLLATEVGGNDEIVGEETGRLLSADFNQEEFDRKLMEVYQDYPRLTRSAERFWQQNYNAQVNYAQFYTGYLGWESHQVV